MLRTDITLQAMPLASRHRRERRCNLIQTSRFGTNRPKIGGRRGLLFEACGRVSDPRIDRGDPDVAILQSKIRRRELDFSLLRGDDERHQGHRRINDATHQSIDSVQPSRSGRFRPRASGSRGRNRDSGTASRWPRACLATRRAWSGAPQQSGRPGASGIIQQTRRPRQRPNHGSTVRQNVPIRQHEASRSEPRPGAE